MGKNPYRELRMSEGTKRALWDFGPPAVLYIILIITLSSMASSERRTLYLVAGLAGFVLISLFLYGRLRRR